MNALTWVSFRLAHYTAVNYLFGTAPKTTAKKPHNFVYMFSTEAAEILLNVCLFRDTEEFRILQAF